MKIPYCHLALLLLVLPRFVHADLHPEEIAIIAVRSSRESVEMAEYYAEARDIPLGHICLIDVIPGRTLDRAAWQYSVRPAIRAWIFDQQLESQLRCLVTVWDVPLKISKQAAADINARRSFLEAERRLRHRAVSVNLAKINGILADNKSAAQERIRDDFDALKLAELIQPAAQAAQRRISLSAPGSRRAAGIELMRSVGELGGGAAGVQIATRQSTATVQPDLELTKKLEFSKGRLLGLNIAKSTVEQMLETIERDEQILAIVSLMEGHVGVIGWIDRQLQLLGKNETYTSFDSELSLLYWLDYSLHQWQPNLLHYQFDSSPVRARKTTLMVSRLEAPTIAHTKRIVDDAIATEKKGLGGKVYLDARGISGKSKPNARGSYGEYDQAIRDLASVLEKHAEASVVLNNEKKLFQQGDCPDTGLYCGWYSLGKYVDAFEFQQGAVGYHIASSEAVTLRDLDSQVWCKRMLEEGICATLGPVHEPYLAAFPRPDEFFVALKSGRYCLAECYYRTKPFNSWVMTLVGDPMYNPFRAKQNLNAAKLSPRLRNVIGIASEKPARATSSQGFGIGSR